MGNDKKRTFGSKIANKATNLAVDKAEEKAATRLWSLSHDIKGI